MPDLLVPDLDPATYERLRQAAADRGKSLAQTARDLLVENCSHRKRRFGPRATACARRLPWCQAIPQPMSGNGATISMRIDDGRYNAIDSHATLARICRR
jgi:plasmid stability protein